MDVMRSPARRPGLIDRRNRQSDQQQKDKSVGGRSQREVKEAVNKYGKTPRERADGRSSPEVVRARTDRPKTLPK